MPLIPGCAKLSGSCILCQRYSRLHEKENLELDLPASTGHLHKGSGRENGITLWSMKLADLTPTALALCVELWNLESFSHDTHANHWITRALLGIRCMPHCV